MSLFDKNKVKLQALEYAEKNKIVNQKSIEAYIAGFNMRDNADSKINLKSVEDIFRKNYESWETDCGYCDLRAEQYNKRRLEGNVALSISNEIKELIKKIENFNKDFNRKY